MSTINLTCKIDQNIIFIAKYKLIHRSTFNLAYCNFPIHVHMSSITTKTCLWGFKPWPDTSSGWTVRGWPDVWNFGFRKLLSNVAKNKRVLISLPSYCATDLPYCAADLHLCLAYSKKPVFLMMQLVQVYVHIADPHQTAPQGAGWSGSLLFVNQVISFELLAMLIQAGSP